MKMIFNKKLWLLTAPLAMVMAGCFHGEDANTNNGGGILGPTP